MAYPQCSSIPSVVEANSLMQSENGVSRKDPSNTRKSCLPSLQIKPCGGMRKSGKNISSHHGNVTSQLLRSSLLRLFSTFVIFWRLRRGFCRHGILCASLL